jgi:hypothetical protein
MEAFMKSSSLLFIAFILSQLIASAQSPDTIWTKTFNIVDVDDGLCVRETSDLGLIVTGYVEPWTGGAADLLLLKTDINGDLLWLKTYDSNSWESGYSVQQTSDDGFIVSGVIGGYDYDIWLLKTDDNGDTLWTERIIYPGNQGSSCIQQISSGEYIIVGGTEIYDWSGDVLLIKTTIGGDTIWTRTYGGNSLDRGYCVQQTTDEGYIIAGVTSSFGAGDADLWLIKTDVGGYQQWNKTYGGYDGEWAYSVEQTSDGGYIVAGCTGSFGVGLFDGWIIKTDSNGDSLWTKVIGGIENDILTSVQETSDGDFIFAGETSSFGAIWNDAWIVKTNADGDILWMKVIGGQFTDFSSMIQQTTDGGYIVVGATESFGSGNFRDVWLIKLEQEIFLINPPQRNPA